MKSLSKSLIIMLATALVVFSCKPDNVNPNSNDSSQEDTPSLAGAAGDAHPSLDPQCGPRMPVKLAKAGGGLDVDWGQFGPPAPGTAWGSGEMFNGIDENGVPTLAMDLTAAFSWSILECDYLIDEPQNIMLDQNTGLPSTAQGNTNNWETKVLPSGGLNAWQMRYDLSNAPSCYNVAIRLKVGYLDFLGGVAAPSITEVWIFNDGWVAGSGTASEYLFNYCTAPCPGDEECTMDFTTYNQCDYGTCDQSGPATSLRDNLFSTAFPNGLVVGCATGNTLTITNANNVDKYLPTKGGQILNNNKNNPKGRVANPNNNLCVGYSVAECVDIDFGTTSYSGCPAVPSGSGLQKGDFVTNQFQADYGITFSGHSNHSNRTGAVIIFDSSVPSGGDRDLGTPNQAYGGPGRGSGGTNPAGRNDQAKGNILILAEDVVDNNGDGRVDDPDDDAAGGYIDVAFETPVTVNTVDLVDLDDHANNRVIFTYSDGSTEQLSCPQIGDNSAKVIDVAAALGHSATDVVDMRVTYSGSGGLAGFNICLNAGPALDTDQCVNLTQGMKSTLGGRLVAAKMNVEFDKADENLGGAAFEFGKLVVRPANNPFAGMTVYAVIAEAENFFGGCGSSFTKGQLNGALKKINNSFRNGVKSNNFLKCPAN